MEISGKLLKVIGHQDAKSLGTIFKDAEATIELAPRELLEQLTHKEVGELLEMMDENEKFLLGEIQKMRKEKL